MSSGGRNKEEKPRCQDSRSFNPMISLPACSSYPPRSRCYYISTGSQCGSSKVAHVGINHFVNRYPQIASRFAIGVIRVVEEKHLSDRVARELGIPHVSPQILLVRQGRAVWHAGHQQINSQQLCRAAMLYGQPLTG